MCGRIVLRHSPAEIAQIFGLDEFADFPASYNVPPSIAIPAIRISPEGKRVLHLLKWGLVPHWSKDPTIGNRLSNARGESVATKPSFRDAFARRRCLVPASGFYEWKAIAKGKQPYFVSLANGEPMALGGLWESWKAPDGEILRTCCVVTTGPNVLMESIHDRMPVVVAKEDWDTWLKGSGEEAQALLRPAPEEGMQAWPVSKDVSRVANDGPGLTAESAATLS